MLFQLSSHFHYNLLNGNRFQQRNRVSFIILGEIAKILVRNPVSNPRDNLPHEAIATL